MKPELLRQLRPMSAIWYERKAMRAMYEPFIKLLEVQKFYFHTWANLIKG